MSVPLALQFPYRESREGFWGEQTSTLNWCEEDYNITFYCAELVNTLTNLVFMWLGFKGLRNVLAYAHSRVSILVFLGYLVVGLGSMAFHTTLKYEMQLADELPMIYTVCIMAYATFSYGRNARTQVLIAAGLVGLAVFITVYYLYAKDPVFHQVAYGLLTAVTVFRGFHVMERDLRPGLSQRNPAECGPLMRRMYRLALTGMLMFLAGFFLWNMDNIFCHHLTATKNSMKLPWSVVLEGHGWWHILTGLASASSCWTGRLCGRFHRSCPSPEPTRTGRRMARPSNPVWYVWGVIQHANMSISNEALQKLVREIESQAIAAQQQISLVRTQVASKQREMRLAQLTRGEIASLPSDTAVYEGVGKMFVGIPAPALQAKLGSQVKEIETEVDALGKRLHYLETTAKNSQEHIEKMLKGAGQP
ncbi:ceramidase-domain-containing protein [Staphylotrichum tortipilum]|uniref:Ceramidase-domain-containing protein n=1 Tax=Staphylotrichum tortipilum TaxID=2831512 RepID=A0AAN6MLZ9_9PEZI|nr:ceramidase-domain-containing protein [Staphylotrichum longicolle]